MNSIDKRLKSKLVNKLKDESFSVDSISNYCLLLNMGYSSFDFAVIDTATNKCILLEEYTFIGVNSDEDLISHLESIWDSHHVLLAGFWKKVRLCIKNQNFTFIPNSLFDKNKIVDYISFSSYFDEEKENAVMYKHLSTDAVNIFSYPKSIESFLQKKYPKIKFETTHQTSAFIEGVIRDNKFDKGKNMFLNVDYDHIVITVIENKNLFYCNRFSFTSSEDFIYYIMFIYNELGLNPEEVKLNIFGEIAPNSPLYDAINKYIRHSSFGKRPKFLNFSYHFDEVFDHKFFNTYAIHLCE